MITVVSWIVVVKMECVFCEITPEITSDALALRGVIPLAAWFIRVSSVTEVALIRCYGLSQSESFTSCCQS